MCDGVVGEMVTLQRLYTSTRDRTHSARRTTQKWLVGLNRLTTYADEEGTERLDPEPPRVLNPYPYMEVNVFLCVRMHQNNRRRPKWTQGTIADDLCI